MMMLFVILNAVLLPMNYSTTTHNHTQTTVTTIVEYYHENSSVDNLNVSSRNPRTLYMNSFKKKPSMFNLFSDKYKKCQSELQALQDSTTTSASIQLNNSREAELIIQLDKEHSIVVLLQQQLRSLQLQNNHLYNRSITSINITSYNSAINESYTNTSFIDGLLSQIYIDQTTIKTLQLQIKLLQLHPINSIIQNNQSSINELRNQLDNERAVVMTLNKQINTLQLQLQEQSQQQQQQQQQLRGSNQNNKSSIETVLSKQISFNSNNNLLKQLENEHNTVVSLQQQIKSFQQLVPGDVISQQDCTSLKIVNTSYKNTNSTDELLKQLKQDRMYINTLEQNVQALILQIHSFHHSNTSQGLLQSKDAIVFDQLQKQLDKERKNSISLTQQLKALKLSHSIVNNFSYIELPYNHTSMYHHLLQKQLQDERVHASSLQEQLQLLKSKINKTSHDNNTASSMKALQKKLEDKHMNVTNLQYQLQYLQSQLQQTTLLSLNKNNNHSITAIENSHIMDSISIYDLQKLLKEERMKNSRLVQQLQSKTFNDGIQLNDKHITNITTLNQFDDERVKYAGLKQQVQSLFDLQKTDGDVLLNSELVKQYNDRIIKTANKELEKQLEDEREKSTRLEQQVLSLELQKTLLVDQVKKGFMEDIRKDSFNTASMSLELDAKKAEITRYKQLLAAKEDDEEEEITQLKQQLRTFQANPLSSSSSSSSVSALKKQHTLHPEMNEIVSAIAVTNKEIGKLIKYDPQSSRHKYSQNVIFSCALSDTYVSNIARFFAGTARNSGFNGDIIVAVLPDAKLELLQVLREYGVIIYIVNLDCVKSDRGAIIMCDFMNDQLSITLMRMFIYQYWAVKYPDTTYIMMSDFRDVMFQSNPFTEKNRFSEWGPSAYDITMFSEQDPNRVINRCRHPSHTLKKCYGKLLHAQLATNTMVNNGILFATRNASLIYVSSSLLNTISNTHNIYIYIYWINVICTMLSSKYSYL